MLIAITSWWSRWMRAIDVCQDALRQEALRVKEEAERVARVAKNRWRLPGRGYGRDGTYPGIGDDVEYVEMGGCMAHIERLRERGKVLKIDAWKPIGAFYPVIYMLVDFPSGQRWEPMETYAREHGGQLHWRSN